MRTFAKLVGLAILCVISVTAVTAQVTGTLSIAGTQAMVKLPDDGRLLVAADSQVLIINGKTVDKSCPFQGQPSSLTVTQTSDGQTLATMQLLVIADAGGQVPEDAITTVVVNLETCEVELYSTPNPSFVQPIMSGGSANFPNERVLLGSALNSLTLRGVQPYKLAVFNPQTGQIEEYLDQIPFEVVGLYNSPDGKWIAVLYGASGQAGLVEFINTADLGEQTVQLPFAVPANSVARFRPSFSGDSSNFYMSGAQGLVTINMAQQPLQPTTVVTPKLSNWSDLQSDGDSGYMWFAGGNVVAAFDFSGNLLTNGFLVVDDGKDGHIKEMAVTRDANLNIDHLTLLEGDRIVFYDAARPTPVVKGVVNSASYKPAVAPGNFASAFGINLANQTGKPDPAWQAQNPNSPFPTSLNGAQLVFDYNGKAAPISYTSPGQINFIVPVDAPLGNCTGKLVYTNANGTTATVPFSVDVEQFAPAIYVPTNVNGGVLTDTLNPVTTGDAVVTYGAGLGPTTAKLATDQPTPLSPLARTMNEVSVTVGGTPAQVFFSGLTPGLVSVEQVNFYVPAVSPGPQDVVLCVNNACSNPWKILVQ